MDWKILALTVPLTFASYQALTKFFPKDISVFLVNAYASLIGFIFMIILHFLTSSNKSITMNPKYLFIAFACGALISIGNFGIIKAFNIGAPQSLFSPIFYIILIIYSLIFGIFFWHESINLWQILGCFLSILGVMMVIYFKK